MRRPDRIDTARGPREPRNPDWTPPETLLALEAYLRLRPRVARPDLEVIIELSGLLRLYGRLRNVAVTQTFRNTVGVARKVFKFSAAERGEAPATIRGAELESTVWDQYDGDLAAVTRDADALRLNIYTQAAARGLDVDAPPSPDVGTGEFTPSQGPAPRFGRRVVSVEDRDCVVYVNMLEGDVASLFDIVPRDERVLKIGRSNAPHRRVRELNAGFPPAMGCGWTLFAVKPFGDAQSAHDAEQDLLRRLHGEGRSLGGEFVRATAATARSWFEET